MSDFIGLVQRLGMSLDLVLRNSGRDEFSRRAHDHLCKVDIFRLFRSTDLLAAISDRRLSGIQRATAFGDLQITIYRGEGFYIEVLYWLDGATTIHDHGFEGAFAILDGCAAQSVFEFVEAERLSPGFRLGEVRVQETRLMRTGMAARIDAGSRFIHSTFHLGRPSVSIVIRTDVDAASTVQLDYDPPFVALNADAIAPDVVKRVKALSIASRVSQEVFDRRAVRCAEVETAEMLYLFLNGGLWSRISGACVPEFSEALLARPFGRRIVASSARREASRQGIINRSNVNDDALRMVLGLALCSHSVVGFVGLVDGIGLPRQHVVDALLGMCGADDADVGLAQAFANYTVGSGAEVEFLECLRRLLGPQLSTVFPALAITQ